MLVDITIAARFTIAARNGASTLGSDRANQARIERESSATLRPSESRAGSFRPSCDRAKRSADAVIKQRAVGSLPDGSYEFERPTARPRLFAIASRRDLCGRSVRSTL